MRITPQSLTISRVLAEIDAYGPMPFHPTAHVFASKLDAATRADIAAYGEHYVRRAPEYAVAQAKLKTLRELAATIVNRLAAGGW